MNEQDMQKENAELEKQARQELKSSQAQVRKEKRVKVRLPVLPDKADMEVYCGVNGQSYRIRRGETVEVPASVEEVLRNCGYI